MVTDFTGRKTTHRAAAIGLLVALLVGCASTKEQHAFDDWVKLDQAIYRSPTRDTVTDSRNVVTEPAEGFTDEATLSNYLAYAAIHNPGLEAAFNRWKASLERIPQVRTLPDPRFNYRYFIENVETRVGPQRQSLGLSQMFPWFGKLELRGGVAVEAARAAQARYEAEKLKLFFNVKKTYYEYYYLARVIAVVRENLELVKYLEEVARTRFKTAEGGHPDVIRAQVELGKLDDRLRTLQDLRGPMMARLNALLNRPTQTPLPWPKQIAEELVAVDDKQLFDWLGKNNPQLTALQHQIAQQRESIRLARKDYYPDLTVGVDYIDTGDAVMPGAADSGNDPILVGVSLNIPLWRDKYDAAVRESLARFGAVTKTHVDRQNTLEADLKTAIYYFHDAERKIDLYRDTLVPKAKQSIKATEAAFRAGTAGFIDLIDAERVLLEFQLAFERALTDRGSRLAEIEMLVGRELNRVGSKTNPAGKQQEPDAPIQENTNHEQ
jgi:outer membrane protein TolC